MSEMWPGRKQLLARIDDARAGIPVWWSRKRFGPDYEHIDPKKHVLVGYANHARAIENGVVPARLDPSGAPMPVNKYDYVYTALCGYTFVHKDEYLFTGPLSVVKTPPPARSRCRKCVKELGVLKTLGKTVGDYIAGFRPGAQEPGNAAANSDHDEQKGTTP